MADKMKADTSSVTDCTELFRSLQAHSQLSGRCGFTLVELIVVTAVLGVLAMMAIPAFNEYRNKAKVAACTASLRTIDKEIQAYFIDKNAFPGLLSDMGIGNPVDPWGRPIEYQVLGPGNDPVPLEEVVGAAVRLNMDYDLYSKGEDGLSGPASATLGNADDITRANDGSYMGLRP